MSKCMYALLENVLLISKLIDNDINVRSAIHLFGIAIINPHPFFKRTK